MAKVEKVVVKFIKEKETKNTIRFEEVQEHGYAKIGTIYVPKSTLAMAGIKPDDGFMMEIYPA